MNTISIVTPNYNQSKFLQENIRSIKGGEEGIEHIIIDGGSIDGVKSIVEKNQEHVSYFVSEKDKGQSHAINKGLLHVSGDYFNWINSDDYLEEGALKKISKVFLNTDINVFVGRSNIIEDGEIQYVSRGTDVYEGNLAKTLGMARIDQPEHWWRTRVIHEIGPLNENLHYIMDRDWWIKYLLRYGLNGIERSNQVLTNFRLHGESKTVSQSASFYTERNSYFYSLAKFYHLNDHCRKIEKYTDAREIEMTNLPEKVNLDMLDAAFSYYYLLLADEAYSSGNFALTKGLLSQIDYKNLEISDQSFYNKLKFRSKFHPRIVCFARRILK